MVGSTSSSRPAHRNSQYQISDLRTGSSASNRKLEGGDDKLIVTSTRHAENQERLIKSEAQPETRFPTIRRNSRRLIAHDGVAPKFQLFSGFNMQFPIGN